MMEKAVKIQDSEWGHMTGGARGGVRIFGRPAKISIGGLIWSSPVPETREEALFYNSSIDRINAEEKFVVLDDPVEEVSKLKIERVRIGDDRMCECHCGSRCALGRLGSQYRCTRAELEANGIETYQ